MEAQPRKQFLTVRVHEVATKAESKYSAEWCNESEGMCRVIWYNKQRRMRPAVSPVQKASTVVKPALAAANNHEAAWPNNTAALAYANPAC